MRQPERARLTTFEEHHEKVKEILAVGLPGPVEVTVSGEQRCQEIEEILRVERAVLIPVAQVLARIGDAVVVDITHPAPDVALVRKPLLIAVLAENRLQIAHVR